MIHRGIATFTLDYGRCPKWLFERMVKLGREIIRVMVEEYGPEEFIRRIGHPVWFQSLGTVLAFDWNASGLTTTLTAALKEALRGQERTLGLFICGGKGKTSRKTPQEIEKWGEFLALPKSKVNQLVYTSKMSAKVDNALVQDGFQIYHHCFFFAVKENKIKAWAVIQQGMNTQNQTARRYHWSFHENDTEKEAKETNFNFVLEPHTGIISQIKSPTLDLTAKKSLKTQQISAELVQGNYFSLMKDIQLLRKHSSAVSKMISLNFRGQLFTFLHLENREFKYHPVVLEDFSQSKYLERILAKICQIKPKNYQELVSLEGVGPKTIRALSLVAELVYGAKPSYEDPARYSFAHGGKDGTPYLVDRKTYDTTIEMFKRIISKTKLPVSEKKKAIERLVPSEGFEPPTFWSEARRSIH